MSRRLALALALFALATSAFAEKVKTFDASYTATVKSVPAGTKELKVWIPLPVSASLQTVSDVVIDSPYKWVRHRDPKFGNEYAFARIENPPAGDLTVTVNFKATRHEALIDAPADRTATPEELKMALSANKLVTISPRIRKLSADITAGKTTTIEKARAIYEYVAGTMKYDKTIPGWGHGDTERACDIRAGNCTDFHSFFLSLARAAGIPGRFVIGFPLTSSDGKVTGYHCWAEFYDKGHGWIPIDASEASQSSDPAVRAYLFGNLDPDRVQFTMGRDLVLNPKTAEPLNYFIYPHAEANGAEVGTPSIALKYREIASATPTNAPGAKTVR